MTASLTPLVCAPLAAYESNWSRERETDRKREKENLRIDFGQKKRIVSSQVHKIANYPLRSPYRKFATDSLHLHPNLSRIASSNPSNYLSISARQIGSQFGGIVAFNSICSIKFRFNALFKLYKGIKASSLAGSGRWAVVSLGRPMREWHNGNNAIRANDAT